MKRKIALFLTGCMLAGTLLAGCGGTSDAGDVSQNESRAAADAASQSGAATEDLEEVVVRFMCFGTVPSDLALVEEAINEITIPEINVKVSYEAISAANYMNQISLDMTSGEKVDVFYVSNYSSMVAGNQLLDMAPYLDEYGPELKAEITEEWLKATSVQDKVYATPALCAKATSLMIAMRSDILEKYGFYPEYEMNETFSDEGMQMSLEDIAEIFQTVKENEPDMIVNYPGVSGSVMLEYLINYDNLGNSYGVLMGNDGWDVVNLYETDEFKSVLQLLRAWYEAGYIKSDAATDTENYMSYGTAGRLFSVFSKSVTGLDTQLKTSTGYDYTCIKLKTPLITSSSLSDFAWGISATTDVPEAAVKFLNLAYSNKDIENLMCYGVEGTHWVYAEEGTVAYPEGVTVETSGYPFSAFWEMPNCLLADSLEGNPADYNTVLAAENKSAPISRALGFAFDESPVKTECTAVGAVYTEYAAGLLTGSLDLDENYDAFIKKLKDAGIDDIIAEKQRQLDAWCEKNNVER